MENTFYKLFAAVNAISKKYENISQITGEGFNVFKILKLDRAENRTHSAFLAELLNPKGSHGQGDTFLKFFTEKFLNENVAFDTPSANVSVEKHIGFMNAEKTEGGRIDIAIKDNRGNEIFLENKIYAVDQKNQLLRYHNHNKNAHLFYLCLEGGVVDEISCGNLEETKHFQVISYKKEIIEWLNECKKEAVSHPILRESITQYINLIKYLTGQTINETMNKEIIDALIKDKEALSASFTIANTVDAACDKLLEKLRLYIDEIAVELAMEGHLNIDWNTHYTGFWFKKKTWNTANITFQFWAKHKRLVYGIGRNEECLDLADPLNLYISEKLNALNGDVTTWWPFVKPVEVPFDDWDNIEPWVAILDGSIKFWIKEKVVEILDLLKNKDL